MQRGGQPTGTCEEPPRSSARSQAGGGEQWTEALLIALLLLVFFWLRWPFRIADLIRDEGEYVHLGQAILRGRIPYLDIYNEKTPFVFYFFALVNRLAGVSVEAVRLATTAFGMLTLLGLYALARQLFNPFAAFWTGLAFVVMMSAQFAIYNQATAEYFGLLWMVLAVLFWYRARCAAPVRLRLLAGIAAGLAYQTKQSGLFVFAFLVAERTMEGLRTEQCRRLAWVAVARDAALALFGFALVVGSTMAYFSSYGALSDYITCTWTNLFEYVGARGGVLRDPRYVQEMAFWLIRHDLGLWVLGTAGVGAMALGAPGSPARHLWALPLLIVASALAAGQFYTQYFQPLLVPLALGAGFLIDGFWKRTRDAAALPSRRAAAALLALAPWVMPAVLIFQWFVLMSRAEVVGHQKLLPPFNVTRDVGRYLSARTLPGEEILVLGSEPEIYYFANRPTASRMHYTYPMAGPYSYAEELRQDFFADWRQDRPRYVAWIPMMQSISEWPHLSAAFVDRVKKELATHYVIEQTFPRGGPPDPHSAPAWPTYVVVLRRSDVPPPASSDT